MGTFLELPFEVVNSIHTYCSLQNSNQIKISYSSKKTDNNTIYLSWYMEWVSYVYVKEKTVWKDIKKHKNNLNFVNLVFRQFDKELQPLAEKTVSKLDNYYQYAKELYIEAHGKELNLRTYNRKELISIIKECEKYIRYNLINQKKPSHNVILLH